MTNGTAPSAIKGDTLASPNAGSILALALPWGIVPPRYDDLPPYWTARRDWMLVSSVAKEAMWAAAVAKTATKFAAHGYVIKDANDSQRKVSASQELFKRANGGEGWVPFALKVMNDLLLPCNGIFIRIRRAGETIEKIRVKAATVEGMETSAFAEAAVTAAAPGARIIGLYHMDSLRCVRTGNLAYPVKYMPVNGVQQILRWDQVLMYADQPSPRAELFGVGRSAADRCYQTISKLAAMEQLVYENLTGGGANKLAFLQGITDATLQGILASGQADAQARGLVYYLGTILGAIPSDTPISTVEIRLKELLTSFVPKDERDNAYLIYANNLGVPVQDLQPLSGQGLGTGTQTVILDEAARGAGTLPAFLKWWEQTVSDRVLPASTELQFEDENDQRNQKARAEVQKLRAETRKVQIDSGEISPAIARQLAVDAEDLPQELLANDATAGGQISDDEKPQEAHPNPYALQLIAGAPTVPPKPGGADGRVATKAKDDDAIALKHGHHDQLSHGRRRGGGGAASAPASAPAPASATRHSEELASALRAAESPIRINPFETAYVFDAHGRQLLRREGGMHEITFSDADAALMRNAVLTHNHPAGVSFSRADVQTLITSHLTEMRAVTDLHRFSLSVPPGTAWSQALETRIQSRYADLLARARTDVATGRRTVKAVNANLHHELWTELSGELGWSYAREDWQ